MGSCPNLALLSATPRSGHRLKNSVNSSEQSREQFDRDALRLFSEALLLPPQDREGFVINECLDNAALRQEVLGLLNVHHGIREPSPLEPIGHYRIVAELGRGNMGIVYAAFDLRNGRKVALKFVNLSGPGGTAASTQLTGERKNRLLSEARTMDRARHPSIVEIYEILLDGDRPLIAMELVEGQSLHEILLRHPALDRALYMEILRQIAEALDHAHRNGVVHRDLKPANIMLSNFGMPGVAVKVKVADFGIAKLIETEGLTIPGLSPGTPGYMSPEQCQGLPVDGRSDQFALGLLAYRMLTGVLPFPLQKAENPLVVSYRIVHSPTPPATSANPELPSAVDRVLDRALAKAPDGRFTHCAEFVEALSAALAGRLVEETVAAPDAFAAPPGLAPAFKSTGRLLLAVLILSVASVALQTVLLNFHNQAASTRDYAGLLAAALAFFGFLRLPFPSRSATTRTSEAGASQIRTSIDAGVFGGLIGGAVAGTLIAILDYSVVGEVSLNGFNYAAIAGAVFGAATQLAAPWSNRLRPGASIVLPQRLSRRYWVAPVLACAGTGTLLGALILQLFWIPGASFSPVDIIGIIYSLGTFSIGVGGLLYEYDGEWKIDTGIRAIVASGGVCALHSLVAIAVFPALREPFFRGFLRHTAPLSAGATLGLIVGVFMGTQYAANLWLFQSRSPILTNPIVRRKPRPRRRRPSRIAALVALGLGLIAALFLWPSADYTVETSQAPLLAPDGTVKSDSHWSLLIVRDRKGERRFSRLFPPAENTEPPLWNWNDIWWSGAEGWLAGGIPLGGGGDVGSGILLHTADRGASWNSDGNFPVEQGRFDWGPYKGDTAYRWHEIGPVTALNAYSELRYGPPHKELWLATATGVYSSIDSGRTWRRSTPPPSDAAYPFAFALFGNLLMIVDPKQVYAVGWQGISEWSDKEPAWQLKYVTQNYYMAALDASASSDIWAVGSSGDRPEPGGTYERLKVRDLIFHRVLDPKGKSQWIPCNVAGSRCTAQNTVLEPDQGLSDIRFVDEKTGFAIGANGVIFQGSRQAGEWSWVPTRNSRTSENLASIAYDGETSTVWVVGTRGIVLNSHNMGRTWNTVVHLKTPTGGPVQITRVRFFERSLWVLGNGVIYRYQG